MSVLDPALAPYAPLLVEPLLQRMTGGALAWIRGFEPDADVKLVVTASVYARLCAPAFASERALDVAARFTLVFFLVDDATLAELPAIVGDDRPWSIGRHTPALRAWLADFRERDAASPRLRARFDRAYQDYLEARRLEHAQGTRVLTLDEHWALRRRTIFMDPYLDHWIILLGLDLEPVAGDAFTEARTTAVDLVLLANDLASVARDQRGGESPDDLNLVHTYVRERGWSPAEAIERLVDLYNDMVSRYRAAIATAVAATAAAGYADLLDGVVDGNVGAVRALQFRYPQVNAIVSRLRDVRGS